MQRILAFLTIPIFVFNLLLPSFAQELPVREQAKRDAEKDLGPVRKSGFFRKSILYSILGCIGGGFLGYQIGTAINDVPASGFYGSSPNDEQSIGCVVGAVLLGGVVVPLFLQLNHNPNPPPERLIGKSPVYVEAYTQAYQKRSKLHVTLGSLTVIGLPPIAIGLSLLSASQN